MKKNSMKQNRMKRMTKADLVLIGILLLIGITCFIAVRLLVQKGGAAVRILSDGELYGTYRLTNDREIPIQKEGQVVNILKISDRKARMIQADCPDQLCVHQKAICRQGETIVCLPNKIVVEIEGEQDAGMDSISR